MKKVSIINSILVFIMLALTISCEKESESVKNEVSSSQVENQLEIIGTLVNYISYYNEFISDKPEMASTAKVKVNDQTLSELIAVLKSQILFNTETHSGILGTILYFDHLFNEASVENLKGVSIFSQMKNTIRHQYFKIEDLAAHEDTRFSGYMNKFISRSFKQLLDVSITEKNNYPSYLVIRNEKYFESGYSAFVDNHESFNLKIINHLPLESAIPIENECEQDGCQEDTGGCEEDVIGESICRFCAVSTFNDQNYTHHELEQTFPTRTAYDFRDNFLSNYEKGNDYIDYYYEISYVISAINSINSENIIAHIDLATEIYDIAQKLQYGNDNEIIISNDFKLDADQMIQYYAGLTTNQDFINILDEISTDLAHFEGKTRLEVLNEL